MRLNILGALAVDCPPETLDPLEVLSLRAIFVFFFFSRASRNLAFDGLSDFSDTSTFPSLDWISRSSESLTDDISYARPKYGLQLSFPPSPSASLFLDQPEKVWQLRQGSTKSLVQQVDSCSLRFLSFSHHMGENYGGITQFWQGSYIACSKAATFRHLLTKRSYP